MLGFILVKRVLIGLIKRLRSKVLICREGGSTSDDGLIFTNIGQKLDVSVKDIKGQMAICAL